MLIRHERLRRIARTFLSEHPIATARLLKLADKTLLGPSDQPAIVLQKNIRVEDTMTDSAKVLYRELLDYYSPRNR
jgi:hypothetical protein